jgi:signal transduction histidine kinase
MHAGRSGWSYPVAWDLAGAASLTVLSVVMAVFAAGSRAGGVVRHPGVLAVVLIAGATLPLGAHRRAPRTVALLSTASCVAALVLRYPTGLAPESAILALFSMAYLTSSRCALAAGAPLGIALLAALVAGPEDLGAVGLASNLMSIGFVLLAGRLLRVRTDQHALLADQHRQLQELGRAQAEAAVTTERMRIAREIHDVVGHSLVAITLQARAGQRRLPRAPERASQALREIEALASNALGETRSAVSAIRSGLAAELAPQPGVDDLGDLAGSMRGPELDIDLEVDSSARSIDPQLQLALYRIAQESLANTARHAHAPPGALLRARVRLQAGPRTVALEVSDDGAPPASVTAEGSGLAGMRERARHFGGSIIAGPGPAGGWQVRARFPLPVTGLSDPAAAGTGAVPASAEDPPAGPSGPTRAGEQALADAARRQP